MYTYTRVHVYISKEKRKGEHNISKDTLNGHDARNRRPVTHIICVTLFSSVALLTYLCYTCEIGKRGAQHFTRHPQWTRRPKHFTRHLAHLHRHWISGFVACESYVHKLLATDPHTLAHTHTHTYTRTHTKCSTHQLRVSCEMLNAAHTHTSTRTHTKCSTHSHLHSHTH